MHRRVRAARAGVAAAVAIGTVAVAGAALAAASAKDPLRLVLQRSDMPAGARWTGSRMPASFTRQLATVGARGEGALHSTEIPLAPVKAKNVAGLVVVVANATQGKRVFRMFKKDLTPSPHEIVRLPSYGDEQVATVTRDVVKGALLVHQGAVVWLLDVATSGTLVMSKTQTLSELKKYAAKQKRRVRGG